MKQVHIFHRLFKQMKKEEMFRDLNKSFLIFSSFLLIFSIFVFSSHLFFFVFSSSHLFFFSIFSIFIMGFEIVDDDSKIED